MEAFVRVVNAGSFTAAARAWGVSKAVMSKYVGSLESHLDVALLHRTTRALSLTEAGRAYHARCIGILDEVAALEGSVRDAGSEPRGRLRVSIPPGLMGRYGDLLTTALITRHPHLSLEIDLTHRMVDLVEEGFDVAIRVTEPRDSALVARRLAPARIVAVASPGYLAHRGTPGHPAELRDHDCLVDTNFRNRNRWPFRDGGEVEVIEVDGPFRVNSPTEICRLASAGHGIALTPAIIARDHLDSGDLVEVLPGMVALAWAIYAVYPRRRYLPARVRAFIDHLAAGIQADARD